jgi:hypothetical protein
VPPIWGTSDVSLPSATRPKAFFGLARPNTVSRAHSRYIGDAAGMLDGTKSAAWSGGPPLSPTRGEKLSSHHFFSCRLFHFLPPTGSSCLPPPLSPPTPQSLPPTVPPMISLNNPAATSKMPPKIPNVAAKNVAGKAAANSRARTHARSASRHPSQSRSKRQR